MEYVRSSPWIFHKICAKYLSPATERQRRPDWRLIFYTFSILRNLMQRLLQKVYENDERASSILQYPQKILMIYVKIIEKSLLPPVLTRSCQCMKKKTSPFRHSYTDRRLFCADIGFAHRNCPDTMMFEINIGNLQNEMNRRRGNSPPFA